MIAQSASTQVKETGTVMQPSSGRLSFAQLPAAEGGLSWFFHNEDDVSRDQVVYITADTSFGHVSLEVENNTGESVTFSPTSVVTIAFKGLLDQKVIGGITFRDGKWGNDDWKLTAKQDYVEVRAKKTLSIEPKHSAEIHLLGVRASSPAGTWQIRITYSGVGASQPLEGGQDLKVFRLPPGARGELDCSFAARKEYYNHTSAIYVSTREDKIRNSLTLKVGRNSRERFALKDGLQPRMFISFIGGSGKSAVASNEDLKEVEITGEPGQGEEWEIDKDIQGVSPVWTLKPVDGTKVLFKAGLTSFRISNLFTDLPLGGTYMYIQYLDMPDFGWQAMDLDKADPTPYIFSFDAYGEKDTKLDVAAPVDLKQPVTLRWNVFAAQRCRLEGIGTFPPVFSTVVYPEASRVYTIRPVPAHGVSQAVELSVQPPEVSISVTIEDVNWRFGRVRLDWMTFNCVVKWETRDAADCEVIDGLRGSPLSSELNGTVSVGNYSTVEPVVVPKNRFRIRVKGKGVSVVSASAPDHDVQLARPNSGPMKE